MKRIKHKKSRPKPTVHEQWIEIEVLDRRVVTSFYPSNEDFEAERLDMDPQPDLIYRRFNFVHGVPEEYMWTVPSPSVQKYGGHFLQRMYIDDWLEVLKKERALNHVVATNCARPLPRPEEWGPCPCAYCTGIRGESAA